jgi:hypothetical protein
MVVMFNNKPLHAVTVYSLQLFLLLVVILIPKMVCAWLNDQNEWFVNAMCFNTGAGDSSVRIHDDNVCNIYCAMREPFFPI